jgi:PilS N terminal
MNKLALYSKQQGYLLSDMILVILVGGIIIVMSIGYFSTAIFNTKVSRAVALIQKLSKASYDWQAIKSQADFTGVSIDVLYQAGLLGPSCSTNPCTMINPWGGATIVQNPTLSANSGHVEIDLQQIPLQACMSLTSKLQNIQYYLSPCGSAQTVPVFAVVI